MITLDIISDPICPWCYIGKAHLDRALSRIERNPFDIHWRPYQLNPDMPREGMDRTAYLEAKFGKSDAVRFYDRIAEAARSAGLEVDFQAIARTPSTLDAHRLIRWSRSAGLQHKIVDALFGRYFSEGQDISKPEILLDAAERAGMDRTLVERLLDSEADLDEIRREDALAREMGIAGVPTFIIDNRFVLSGSQDSRAWIGVIDQLETVPT